jgi:hypothetical protein
MSDEFWHVICYILKRYSNSKEEVQMKKVLSTIVAALVAVSFAGIVCATEPATPAAPAAPEVKKEEVKKPVKKAKKKAKKVKKAEEKKVEAAPAEAPAAPAK